MGGIDAGSLVVKLLVKHFGSLLANPPQWAVSVTGELRSFRGNSLRSRDG